MLQLMDSYAATYAVLIIALVECLALSWVYGRLLRLKDWLEKKLSWFDDLYPNDGQFNSILYFCLGLLHLLIILVADYRLRQIKGRHQIDAG